MQLGTVIPAEHARCPTNAALGEPIPRARTGKNDVLSHDITRMFLPGKTGRAILADAGTAAKAERAKSGGPQVGGLLLQPALDVGKGFGFYLGLGWHVVRMSHIIHACQQKLQNATKFCSENRLPA